MILKDKYNPAIAILLLVLLINPMLVKLVHRHDIAHKDRAKHTLAGLNKISDHHNNCEICSFDFVNIVINGTLNKSGPLTGFYIFLAFLKEKSPSQTVVFALLRAPPVISEQYFTVQ
jgi:hypothetical protein